MTTKTGGRRPAGTALACAGAAAVVAAYGSWLLTARPDPRVSTLIAVLISVAATAAAVSTARSVSGPLRAPWRAVAIAVAGGSFGIGVWAVMRFGWDAAPSWMFAPYLLFPSGMAAAVLLFPGRPPRAARYRMVLDGVIMGASLLIVSWLTVLRHTYAASEGGYHLVLSLAYPVADIGALTVAAAVLIPAPPGIRPTLSLLTVGLLGMTAVEAVFAYSTLGGESIADRLFELGWTAGMAAVLLATRTGRAAVPIEGRGGNSGWAAVLLPYGPLLLAATVIAVQPFSVIREPPVLVAGLVLLPAVLIRQVIAVKENNRLIAAVTYQAQHDPLTGLANRALFADRLAGLLNGGDDDGEAVAVIVIDLDGFKAINDEHGHLVGDTVLVAVAERLRDEFGAVATVARWGGDEFALLTRTSPAAADRLVDRIGAIFQTPIALDGHRFRIGARAGLAMAGPVPSTADELVRRADLNMYAAKRTGPASEAPPRT